MDFKKLPKVELHRHLDCSMRFTTLVEIADEVGILLPKSEAEQRAMFLITEPMVDLAAVLNKFKAAQKALASEVILERLAFECVEDAFHENIQVLELRYAPTFIQEGHPNLSFDQIHRALAKGVARARTKYPVKAGFIAIFQRTLPVSVAENVLDFVLNHKENFIGVDLADNEMDFDAKPFAKLFQKAKVQGLGITVHAGEPNMPKAAQNVREAIDLLGADRIGHGLQIYKDPEILKYVVSKKIPLELCLTSNYLTQAVPTLADHPIKKLDEAGVLVTLSTDDPGIFDLSLTGEYALAHKYFGFSEKDFSRFNQNARAASFIKGVSHA